ncbi:MAG: hypothetical protein Q7U28_06370 [Aquabacterium sp.]|nr:hypothetical protein [Aquabacterium sp.]
MHLHIKSWLVLGLFVAGGSSALAGTYQSAGNVNTIATNVISPQPESVQHVANYDWINNPQAATPTHIEQVAEVSNGGISRAGATGQIGVLKAWAEASYPAYTASTPWNGYATGTALASFYDTIAVTGAGLAVGTPVTYTLSVYVNGTQSSPTFEIGGAYSAYALSEARLTNVAQGTTTIKSWNADKDAVGWYNLSLDTVVGSELGVSAMLYVGAYVSAYATVAHSAFADYGHSAHYYLTPSIASLNTIGSSGHDFTISTAVPEPQTAVLALLGLFLVTCMTKQKRATQH